MLQPWSLVASDEHESCVAESVCTHALQIVESNAWAMSRSNGRPLPVLLPPSPPVQRALQGLQDGNTRT